MKESHRLQSSELLRDWSGEELERVLFLESDVAKPGCKLPVRAPRTLIGSPLVSFQRTEPGRMPRRAGPLSRRKLLR